MTHDCPGLFCICVQSIGKLQRLRVLRMARNKLNTVKDLEHLMPLRALTAVSIHDNPIADHPHTRVSLYLLLLPPLFQNLFAGSARD